MKKFAGIAIALCLIADASAQIVITSALRSVNVSGARPGDSYNQSLSDASSTANLAHSVSGSASETVAAGSGAATLASSSSASQTSSLLGSSLSVAGSLRASNDELFFLPSLTGGAWASSVFEITFNLLADSNFSFGGERSLFQQSGGILPEFTFSLTDAYGAQLLGTLDLLTGKDGFFSAGAYTMVLDTSIYAGGDPFGSIASSDFRAELRTTAVSAPDMGTTAALVAVGLAGVVIAAGLRRRHLRRVQAARVRPLS